MPGLKHTPFWEDPEAYEEFLGAFLRDCGRDDSKAVEQRKYSKGDGSEAWVWAQCNWGGGRQTYCLRKIEIFKGSGMCMTVRKFQCPTPCAASRSRAIMVYKSSLGHFWSLLLHLCQCLSQLEIQNLCATSPWSSLLCSKDTDYTPCFVRFLLLLKLGFVQHMAALPLSSLNQNPGFCLLSIKRINLGSDVLSGLFRSQNGSAQS